MSGHSKWSTIKHKKANTDAKRGKIFTKIIKEITIAAKLGGGDQGSNPRLRTAVLKAKDANMPMDNINRAIKKGTGELPGVSYEELTYHGYGPCNVAIILEVLTDNKNRAAAEIRKLFSKGGGHIGESGSVSWLFEEKGLIVVSKDGVDEDNLTEIILEAGGEDIVTGDESYEVYTQPGDFETVCNAIKAGGIKIDSSELGMIPKTMAEVPKEKAEQVAGFLESLDDYDDTQSLYNNAHFES